MLFCFYEMPIYDFSLFADLCFLGGGMGSGQERKKSWRFVPVPVPVFSPKIVPPLKKSIYLSGKNILKMFDFLY